VKGGGQENVPRPSFSVIKYHELADSDQVGDLNLNL
jgi:hypothetical protein